MNVLPNQLAKWLEVGKMIGFTFLIAEIFDFEIGVWYCTGQPTGFFYRNDQLFGF